MSNTEQHSVIAIVALVAAVAALVASAAALFGVNRQANVVTPAVPSSIATSLSAEPLTDSAPETAEQSQQSLQSLTDELRQEQASRLELQRQVNQLEEALAANSENLEDLRQQLDTTQPADDNPAEGFADSGSEAAQQAHQAAFGESAAGASFGRGFGGRNRTSQQRIASLQEAGVDEVRAGDLIQRIDRNQLAELELRDEAARGGWLNSDEFDERLDELQNSAPDLRSELGDDAYDRYLFSNGTPNRVVISSIIDGSAAQAAGIEVRDVLISYAGQRLFTMQELQDATREGVRGESVTLLVRRGSSDLNLTVSRGPLGVTMTRDLQEPDR